MPQFLWTHTHGTDLREQPAGPVKCKQVHNINRLRRRYGRIKSALDERTLLHCCKYIFARVSRVYENIACICADCEERECENIIRVCANAVVGTIKR